jgi:hypothetical protein
MKCPADASHKVFVDMIDHNSTEEHNIDAGYSELKDSVM